MTLKRKKSWDKVTPQDYNAILNELDMLKKFRATGPGISMSSGPLGRTISLKSVISGGEIRRAQTREAASNDDVISVNLLDSDSAEIDDAIDVFVLPSEASIDQTKYLPKLVNDMKIIVMKDLNGSWYLVHPTLLEVGAIGDTISATAATLGGRLLNKWWDICT